MEIFYPCGNQNKLIFIFNYPKKLKYSLLKMFNIPKNLGEYGKWYDENLYPFNLRQISDYYLRHIKADGTIDITKFDSTFHRNEISHYDNAVITKTWYKNLNLKINVVTCGLVLLILYDVGKTVYKIYRKKKDIYRVDDL